MIIMKKILFLALLVMSTAVFAASVDRSMPERVEPSTTFTATFTINPEGTLSAFDLADFVPNGWNLNDWSVSGYSKSDVVYDSQVREYQGKTRNGLHWAFKKPLNAPVTLSYTMTAPAAQGTYEFIAVWTYPSGFNSKTSSLRVETALPSQPSTPTQPTTPTSPTTPTAPTTPTTPGQPSAPNYTVGLVILVIIIIAGAAYMLRNKKKKRA